MIIKNKARAITTDIDTVQELMNELNPKRCSTLMRKIRKQVPNYKIRKQVPNYRKRDDCEEVTLHLNEHEAKFLRAVIGHRYQRRPLRGGPCPEPVRRLGYRSSTTSTPTVERTKR